MKKRLISSLLILSITATMVVYTNQQQKADAAPIAGVNKVLAEQVNNITNDNEDELEFNVLGGVTKEMALNMRKVEKQAEEEAAREELKKKQEKAKRKAEIEKAKQNIVTLYTKGNTNVRAKATTDSAIVKVLGYNTEVTGWVYKDWLHLEDNSGCISTKVLSEDKMQYRSIAAPYSSGKKSWMPYQMITDGSSKQYKLQRYAYTGTYGIRQVNGRYCVALGNYWGIKVGQYFDLVLENGTIIPCIMADVKADCDTDSSNCITVANGCMSEFVVCRHSLVSRAKRSGSVNSCCDAWDSRIVEVRVYDKNILC